MSRHDKIAFASSLTLWAVVIAGMAWFLNQFPIR